MFDNHVLELTVRGELSRSSEVLKLVWGNPALNHAVEGGALPPVVVSQDCWLDVWRFRLGVKLWLDVQGCSNE